MKRLILIAMAIISLAGGAWAAGSASSCNAGEYQGSIEGGLIKYTCTFTADNATGAIPNATIVFDAGLLMRIETDPGSTGPTDDALDIVINTPYGADITGGALQNRDATDTEIAYPASGATVVHGSHTLVFTNNLVNSATGSIYIYVLKIN